METLEAVKVERVYDIAKMKASIKSLSEKQRALKTQRKTIKLVGKRWMEASDAVYKHAQNRMELSAMYVAYGIMRGKDLNEMKDLHLTKKEENVYYMASLSRDVDKYLKDYKLKK